MNILVIGNGGREHALVETLSKSSSVNKIYAAPGNPGIFTKAEKAGIHPTDHSEVIEFAMEKEIDLVVIGPELPLAEGIADALREEGINCFGPSKQAAQLESSKAFAKEFMLRNNIPTANFRQFHKYNEDEAHQFIDCLEIPIVIKADGLAGGKGVIIAETHTEAHNFLDEMFDGLFDSASETVVIEEFLPGQEASVLAICDGDDFVLLSTAQDHKRIYDDDKGPNTGGMGVYAPAPICNEEVMKATIEQIIIPTLEGMKNEMNPFVGCLYVGLMIDNNIPKVIEYNVRFGDPETEAVLPLFKGDFAKLLYSAAIGEIDKTYIEKTDDEHACTVILASKGYPGSFDKGFEITGIDEAEKAGAMVFQAGTKLDGSKLVNNSGRVLAVTGLGSSLKEAIDNAYKYANLINFKNKYNRTDIGKKGLTYYGKI